MLYLGRCAPGDEQMMPEALDVLYVVGGADEQGDARICRAHPEVELRPQGQVVAGWLAVVPDCRDEKAFDGAAARCYDASCASGFPG